MGVLLAKTTHLLQLLLRPELSGVPALLLPAVLGARRKARVAPDKIETYKDAEDEFFRDYHSCMQRQSVD